jgi:integrase
VALRLTNNIIRTLEPPAAGNRITYDSAVPGFGVRITAGGVVAFVLNYRVRSTGRERRYTIGQYPVWLVAAAREKARELKREVDGGGDPLDQLKAEREAPTMADLCAEVETEHLGRLRPKTRVDYQNIIRNQILPVLAERKVADVKSRDIERLFQKISAGAPIQANRTLAVLSKIFTLAIKWEYRTDNPCKGVKRNQETKRKRYLKDDELLRLTKAFAEYQDKQAANIFRLLLLTGARRSEVLSAKWEHFDLKEGMWTKPAGSTKQKAEHSIPLNAPARQLLASLPKLHDEWLFPGRGGQHHRLNLKNSWSRICKAAGITGLRIHDLRHSYASTLVSAGFSLPVNGALLGHSQPQTTHRYAHLLRDPLLEATERAGAILMPKTKAGGRVVTIRGRSARPIGLK